MYGNFFLIKFFVYSHKKKYKDTKYALIKYTIIQNIGASVQKVSVIFNITKNSK